MKRREFLKTAGAGLAASTAVAAPAIAQSMPELKWRCTTSWPKSLDVPYQRVGDDFEIRRGSHRQQIPDSGFRRRRDRSSLAGGRRGEQRHGRDVSHRRLLLHRQGSDLRALLLGSVRAELAPAERLVPGSRRPGHAQRVRQEVQTIRHRRRQHRHPDGRLVPQGDQHRRRPQRPQNADRRMGRQDPCQARHRSAADRRRRYLSGAGKGHHRRHRMGRSLRRREARLLQGRQVLLLSRLVGGRHGAALLHVVCEPVPRLDLAAAKRRDKHAASRSRSAPSPSRCTCRCRCQ